MYGREVDRGHLPRASQSGVGDVIKVQKESTSS